MANKQTYFSFVQICFMTVFDKPSFQISAFWENWSRLIGKRLYLLSPYKHLKLYCKVLILFYKKLENCPRLRIEVRTTALGFGLEQNGKLCAKLLLLHSPGGSESTCRRSRPTLTITITKGFVQSNSSSLAVWKPVLTTCTVRVGSSSN